MSLRRLLVLLTLLPALGLVGSQAVSGETLAPGVTYTQYSASPSPNKVYVVAIDRLHSEYQLEVGYAQGKRNYTARERTSQIFSRYDTPPTRDVIAATNGAYFDTVTAPRLIGIGQSVGEMLDTPSFNSSYTYHTVMIGQTRTPIVRTNFSHVQGAITFPDGFSMPLAQYNFYMGGPLVPISGVSAFTPGFDSSTRTDFSISPTIACEVILTNVSYPMRGDKEVSGIVSAIQTGTAASNNLIPAGGMVLSTWGSTKATILAHAHVGDRLRVKVASGAEEYNTSDNALTGIGWIIHDGAAYSAGWQNLESGAYVTSRAPRTVLAWNDTTWFQVVVDGRTSASLGMTFQEMANFLIGTLGAREAVNYDGGGSSTMVVNGVVKNVPSDSGGERYIANAIMLVKRNVATPFPVMDSFAATGRTAGWDDKFVYSDVVPFSPASPGGDGYVLKVADPSGGVDTTKRGDFSDTDYTVQSHIYCEYRPDVAADGYERYAVFARDNGAGALGLANYGGGNCYALTFDGDTGRIRAGVYTNGTLADFLPTPLYMAATAWRTFRIACAGSNVRYYVDGAQIANVTDTTFARGYFGIGYHEFFATNSNIHGTRADNFSVALAGSLPGKAWNPTPADSGRHANLNATLGWLAGAGALSHDVYFGETSPGTFRGNQASTTFNPGSLQLAKTYYWHVDEVNENGTTPGDVWSFTAQYYKGDMDNDTDVDLEDWGLFQACLSGTNVPADPICDRADIAGVPGVDQEDVAAFLQCLSGPEQPASASCLTGQ